jgi:predicted O-methyltransferase YrrM
MLESCIFALMVQLLHRLIYYIKYKIKAQNEHAFHSPFVFDFATKVVYSEKEFYTFDAIEKLRLQLQNNHSSIQLEELGAKTKGNFNTSIAKVAKQAVLPKKYAQLLFKCIDYFQPNTILELGTNLGLTTGYLAAGNRSSKVFSIEGNKVLADMALQNLKALQIDNVNIVNDLFDKHLPPLLKANTFDFIYVDGNHTETATLLYFEWLKAKQHPNMVIVFDDIYWSAGMTKAWAQIKKDETVSLTLDLYKYGFVFFKLGMEKQDFVVRF